MARKREESITPERSKTEPEKIKAVKKSKVKAEADAVDPSDTDYAQRCKVLGENIRYERKSRGFSIENLAKYLELSTSYVGLLERGARCPSIRKFFDICVLFGTSPNDLLLDRNASAKDGRMAVAEQKRTYQKNNYDAIKSLVQNLDEKQLGFVVDFLKNLIKLDK